MPVGELNEDLDQLLRRGQLLGIGILCRRLAGDLQGR
jgi:hypothetical protein